MNTKRGLDRCGRNLAAFILPCVIGTVMTRPAEAQQVGQAFRDCAVCPEMIVVPAGSFIMGSPSEEEGRLDDEGPQHRVTIPHQFAVGVYEITFEEWDACVRAGGCDGYEADDQGWGRGKRPVIGVSWDRAWLYADWLVEQTGEEYRLLSEAEWEYVARAGTRTARYWGETLQEQCRYANGYDATGYAEHSDDYGFLDPVGCRDRQASTALVGSYPPNGFGLYDMLGNVEEWVDDCWNDSYEGAPTDGKPWYSGECSQRIVRGGSWLGEPRELRSAERGQWLHVAPFPWIGFRVARTIN